MEVKHLYAKYGRQLELNQVGKRPLNQMITASEAERPGLSLAGYLKNRAQGRILIFGMGEIDYLLGLDTTLRKERIRKVLEGNVPAVIVARGLQPLKELENLCLERSIALFQTPMHTMHLFSRLMAILSDEFALTISCHGTLVEAFGIGVLLTGESAVGKSEAALGLIERRHRLISDDVVRMRKKEESYLEGWGPEITRHMLEIRGIGIINVAHLYGAVCVSEKQRIDIVIKLEQWNDTHFYDRIGLDEKQKEFLGIQLPYYLVPVKPGRDVALLIETIVLNYRLKKLGYNSAKEFNRKLVEEISRRQEKINQ